MPLIYSHIGTRVPYIYCSLYSYKYRNTRTILLRCATIIIQVKYGFITRGVFCTCRTTCPGRRNVFFRSKPKLPSIKYRLLLFLSLVVVMIYWYRKSKHQEQKTVKKNQSKWFLISKRVTYDIYFPNNIILHIVFTYIIRKMAYII